MTSSINKNIPNSELSDSLRIGRQIRDLRKAKGITLNEMATQIGKSVGYVSQVERGVSNLPIPVLQAISEALGVNTTWFFHQEGEQDIDELDHVVRGNSRRKLSFSGTGFSEELLSPSLSGELLMILTTIAPQAKSDPQPRIRHGEEAGFLKSGKLRLTIGDKSFKLSAGDAFSITGKEQHAIENLSNDEDAVIVWVITPPNY